MVSEDKAIAAAVIVWILLLLGSLGVTGVVIWALVKLVLHFTG